MVRQAIVLYAAAVTDTGTRNILVCGVQKVSFRQRLRSEIKEETTAKG